MNVLGRIMGWEQSQTLLEIAQAQMVLIRDLRVDSKRQELAHTKNVRDLLVQFRVLCETEIDPRDSLDAAISDMEDQMARLQEHLP